MPSIKSLLDPMCGGPSPLSSLSNNYGDASSKLESGVEEKIRTMLPASTENELIRDYLTEITKKTHLPLEFDVKTLLGHIQRPIGTGNELYRNNSPQSDTVSVIAQNWIEEFLKGRIDSPMAEKLSLRWIEEFEFGKYNREFENIWNASRQKSISTSISASEFLDTYDKVAEDNIYNWADEFFNGLRDLSTIDETNSFDTFDHEMNALGSIIIEREYKFNSNNPYMSVSNQIEQAKEMMLRGQIADAILYYEAALQKNPDDAETWYSLGLCHSENEQDPLAILALKNALKIDPKNCKALLAFAVSLINESYDYLALKELEKWLAAYNSENFNFEQNYSSLNTFGYNPYSLLDVDEFNRIENKFFATIQKKNETDIELQSALSVFYNLGRRYDRAIDCIRTAISINSENPILWNRLGATLANADRSTEAIEAYKHALKLFPSYVRAHYNLGISCMNLGSYNDATVNFLAALKIQNTPETSQIWSKLRSSIIRTEYHDSDVSIMGCLNSQNLDKLLEIFDIKKN